MRTTQGTIAVDGSLRNIASIGWIDRLTDMTFPNFNLSAAFRVAACASALIILQARS
jgi:hypothetical protein